MKTKTFPLTIPSDLLEDLSKAARRTGLSIEDTMRQSMVLGLPCLVKPLPSDLLTNLKPFTPEESRRCFTTPDPEFDAPAAHCAALPMPIPET